MSDEFGEIELRCPYRDHDAHGPILLAKVFIQPATLSPRIVEGNLIEVECRRCRTRKGIRRMLHRFNVLGEHVEDVVSTTDRAAI